MRMSDRTQKCLMWSGIRVLILLGFREDVKFLECQVQVWPEENLEVRTDKTGPRGMLCFQYFSSRYLSTILPTSIGACSPPLWCCSYSSVSSSLRLSSKMRRPRRRSVLHSLTHHPQARLTLHILQSPDYTATCVGFLASEVLLLPDHQRCTQTHAVMNFGNIGEVYTLFP